MQKMLTNTKTRHKKIRETFKRFKKKTKSVDEAVRLTSNELGYSISYINKIRYRKNV